LLVILFCFIFFNSFECKSDVIYIPVQFSIFSTSYESIYSLEKRINSKNTLNYWGGGGLVYSHIPPSRIPAIGLELAVEPRHYFKEDIFRKSFISAYIGIAYMKLIDDHFHDQFLGIIPGIKYTYKFKNTKNKSLMVEPYFSISSPVNYNINDNNWSANILTFTAGIRIGFNKIITNNK